MDDCITRKAAHEMVRNLTRYVNVEIREMHGVNEMVDYDVVQHGLDKLPAADVVEAVRCKDCKLWDYSYALGGMVCTRTRCGQPEDGFCNWAEKKEVQSNNG